MEKKNSLAVFWFRRDFRIEDNAGFYHALKESTNVLPLFIFDTTILDALNNKTDLRVEFIHRCIGSLQNELRNLGSDIMVVHGNPEKIFNALSSKYPFDAVYCNHDYEPKAIERDLAIRKNLISKGIKFHSYKDQVIFEKNEITKDDGNPYTIFTPYMRKWKAKLTPFFHKEYPCQKYYSSLIRIKLPDLMNLKSIGFSESGAVFPCSFIHEKTIKDYKEKRDYPALDATSRISVHLRFGTVSIRKLVQRAKIENETWLNELIWREFYMMILFHFPHITKRSFKKQYDKIIWLNNEENFVKWCQGKTGYPIVDAGMRELNETGFMHNRVRMITASFLTKHLLIDWRWGEAYFAEKLLDYELSSNNGGWQWSASSGCDAAPYFRVFNPWEQTKKFDPQSKYIKKWIPEYDELNYIQPIVDHKFARERVLKTFKEAVGKAE